MMKPANFYSELARIVRKPGVFSVYTAQELWADSHTSEQMLAFHLNAEIDVSSRRADFIDESVAWINGRFGLGSGKRVIDLGCGPGLYASRLAACGARVTAIDFSPTSIAYAREQAQGQGHEIAYHQANYLEYEPEGQFSLILMIMCDFCALSPAQRGVMLDKAVKALASDGRLVFDVYSLSAWEEKQETLLFEENLLKGFWSSSPYFGFLASFKYQAEQVSLDKYVIIEEHRQREVYNWLQYFSVANLQGELGEHGLVVETVLGDVAGHAFDDRSSEFAVVAKRAGAL